MLINNKRILIFIVSLLVIFFVSYLNLKKNIPNNLDLSKESTLLCNNNVEIYKEILQTHYPPYSNQETFKYWRTYSNQDFGYTMMYPNDWGIGAKCNNESKEGLINIGPELLAYPLANCGTANIPGTVSVYYQKSYKVPEGYSILKEKDVTIGGIKSKSYIYVIDQHNRPGSTIFGEVVIPHMDGFLVFTVGHSGNYVNYKNTFDKILTTVSF